MNEKAKNWFGKHKWHIVCGFVSAGLIVGCALNIYYACKSDVDANIFTAIGGWVGFLATAGVGVITIYQNKRSERHLIRETEINKLYNIRAFVYIQKNAFVQDNDFVEVAVRIFNNNFDMTNEINALIKNYRNFCISQANDIYLIRYKFTGLIVLQKKLLDLVLYLNKLQILLQKKSAKVSMFKEIDLLRYSVVNTYIGLLIDIDDALEKLSNNRLCYKAFSEKIAELKDCEGIKEILDTNFENYDKETKNGQAEDDVDGQGK